MLQPMFIIVYIVLYGHGISADTPPLEARHGVSQELDTKADFGFDMSGCGSSKGCYLFPENCIHDNCSIFISWHGDGEVVNFEMSILVTSVSDRWIGLGFSRDKRMGDTSVVACIKYDGTNSKIASHFNQGTSPRLLANETLGLVESSFKVSSKGSRLECEFSRLKIVDNKTTDSIYVYPLNEAYYLQLGNGPASSDGGLHMHEERPIVTPYKIDVADNQVHGGTFVDPLLKAHVCLMMAAWLLLAGIGIMNARFFKATWGIEIANIKLWFWIHRTCMSLVWALSVCGFVIIFYFIGGFINIGSDVPVVQRAHPIIGIIVMILATMNPIMALVRPHPGTDRRPMFNWAHLLVGESGRILAVANIMIGFWIPRSKGFTDIWMFWTIVGLVIFHCLVEVILYFVGKSKPNKYVISTDKQLQVMDGSGNEIKDKKHTFQTVMLFIYGAVMLAYSIAAFVKIGEK